MSRVIRKLKKLFWSLPLSPKFKEQLRMQYATLKDLKEETVNAKIELSKHIDKDAYIKQILSIPTDKDGQYVNYVEHEEREYPVDIIAYYLTQYHPNPQNDEWWGKGTTEWTNVSKAVPQFLGHYQPRLPGELGYYDLRLSENFTRQIELARNYGIKAFCFYYYWFEGKRLLERPLDLFLTEKELDINFCICWANENWTRKFTGTNADILMKVGETNESYINFIYDVLDVINDSRYYCIYGKPVLSVYRPSLIPDSILVISEWKKVVKERLNKELYVIAVQEKGDKTDWCSLGFDAETEFQPKRVNDVATEITDKIQYINKNFNGTVYDYKDLVENRRYIIETNLKKKVYPAVMPMWDNTARRNTSGIIYHGANAELYGKWLKDVVRQVNNNSKIEKGIVFINAWNEWGEGAYLEPDRKNGYAYLEKTYQTLNEESKVYDKNGDETK